MRSSRPPRYYSVRIMVYGAGRKPQQIARVVALDRLSPKHTFQYTGTQLANSTLPTAADDHRYLATWRKPKNRPSIQRDMTPTTIAFDPGSIAVTRGVSGWVPPLRRNGPQCPYERGQSTKVA